MVATISKLNDNEIVENDTICGRMAAYMDDNTFRNHIMHGALLEQDCIFGMLEPYIKRSKYMVDVGAHSGHQTIAWSYLNPNAIIHSFEPQKHMFDLLTYNVGNNVEQCKNVNLYNVAVGRNIGSLTLSAPRRSTIITNSFEYGGTSFGKGGEEVDVITIDSLNLQGLDYLKIDVEGAEPLVIEGATETIKKYRPFIMYEHNHTTENREDFDESCKIDKEVKELLEDLEYQIIELVYDNYLAVPVVKSKFKNLSSWRGG